MITVQFGGETFTIPYADLLPPLAETERAALRRDIQKRGVIVPIIVDEDNQIIDGQHRLTIAAELQLDPRKVSIEVRAGLSEEQRRALALDLNLHRRHLSAEERQNAVRRLREEGQSVRQIADTLHVPRSTVHRDIDRTGVPYGTPEPVAALVPDQVLAPEPAALRVTGRDGKQYPASQPRQRLPDPVIEEARQQAIAEAAELDNAIMTADAALNDGGVRLMRLLRDLGPEVRALPVNYPVADVCAAIERHPDMDHIRTDIHNLRRWAAAIERRLSVGEGATPALMGAGR